MLIPAFIALVSISSWQQNDSD